MGFDFFYSLTPLGKAFYTQRWDAFLTHIFRIDFLLWWILFIFLVYFGDRFKKILICKYLKSAIFFRRIFLLIPIVFVFLAIFKGTNGVPHFEDEFTYLY